MSKKIINGRWYSNIYDPENPKKKIVVSLDAYAPEKRKSDIALGAIQRDLENGIRPISLRTTIARLRLPYEPKERPKKIFKNHIHPFFGKYKPKEVDHVLIAAYIGFRFGHNAKGELQAYANTLDKELLALQQLLQVVLGKTYRVPRVPFKKLKRSKLRPLNFIQIQEASKFVGKNYIEIFWLMALTGIEIADCLALRPMDFKQGWLDTERSKTGEIIRVPVCPFLWDILKPVPWPIDKEEPLFKKVTADSIKSNITRAFNKAGLKGYGSKYLRRFIGSILLHLGNTESWIATMLSHAEGSNQTKEYLDIYPEKAMQEFNKITVGGMK